MGDTMKRYLGTFALTEEARTDAFGYPVITLTLVNVETRQTFQHSAVIDRGENAVDRARDRSARELLRGVIHELTDQLRTQRVWSEWQAALIRAIDERDATAEAEARDMLESLSK